MCILLQILKEHIDNFMFSFAQKKLNAKESKANQRFFGNYRQLWVNWQNNTALEIDNDFWNQKGFVCIDICEKRKEAN